MGTGSGLLHTTDFKIICNFSSVLQKPARLLRGYHYLSKLSNIVKAIVNELNRYIFDLVGTGFSEF